MSMVFNIFSKTFVKTFTAFFLLLSLLPLLGAEEGESEVYRKQLSNAVYAYSQGNFDEAEEDFISLLGDQQGDHRIHFYLANIYFLVRSNFTRAEGHYQAAIEFKPTASAYNNYATLKYAQQDYQKAEALFFKAIILNPQQISSYIKLAQIYIDQERFGRAIDLLQEGLRMRPDEEEQQKIESLIAALTLSRIEKEEREKAARKAELEVELKKKVEAELRVKIAAELKEKFDKELLDFIEQGTAAELAGSSKSSKSNEESQVKLPETNFSSASNSSGSAVKNSAVQTSAEQEKAGEKNSAAEIADQSGGEETGMDSSEQGGNDNNSEKDE